jgi:hypothetical protein
LTADDKNDDKKKSAHGHAYDFATGRTYMVHAFDHARLLRDYSAEGDKVPKQVVDTHLKAIRHNVDNAKKSYSKLAEAAKTDPAVAKKLTDIQKQLDQVLALAKKIEAEQQPNDGVPAATVALHSRAIESQIRDTHANAEDTAEEFSTEPDSYYFSGRGHFED